MALPAGRYGVTKNQLLKIKKLPMNTIKLIEDLYEKYSLLGSAAFKNSTSVVTQSTDLVESGAVKDIVGWGNKNLANLPDKTVGAGLFIDDTPVDLPIGTYTVSFTVSGTIGTDHAYQVIDNSTSPQKILETADLIEGRNSITFTTDAPITKLKGYTNSSNTLNYSNFQLEVGSTATAYEPYHASVEDYCASKQDVINTVGWCSTVLDKGVIASANVNGDGTINISTFSVAYFKVEAGKKYTVSNCNDFTDRNLVFGYYVDVPVINAVSYNNSRTVIERGTVTSQTVTAPIDGYIVIRINNSTDNIRFEEGEVVTQSVEDKKADNSVIGTVEDGINPTKAYAVDEFMVRDGAFCQVTAPVTTSSTWTEGSNYTKKSIAEVLQSLMS